MAQNSVLGGMPFDAVRHTNIETGAIEYDRQYPAKDFADYFNSFIGNGIFPNPADGFKVTSKNYLNINVAAGKAWINGYYVNSDKDIELNLPIADPAHPRIDRIVLRLNLIDRYIELMVKSGEPNDSPQPPELARPSAEEQSADYYELGIADIMVKASTLSVSDSDITDLRLDTQKCGIVAVLVEHLDTTELFNQYQDYLDKQLVYWDSVKQSQADDWSGQMTEQENSFDTQLAGQKQEFNEWFEGIQVDINNLKVFYYQNWYEQPNCYYVEYPKNGQGEYISEIKTKSGVLVAQQKDYEKDGSFITEIIQYKGDGSPLTKRIRTETKQEDGAWRADVTESEV